MMSSRTKGGRVETGGEGKLSDNIRVQGDSNGGVMKYLTMSPIIAYRRSSGSVALQLPSPA